MKLLNRSLLYLSAAFLLILGVWSVVFYYNLKEEIRDSIDDGLDNSRLLIIQKVGLDTTLLQQNRFGGNNFEIHPLSPEKALQFKDHYRDTLMYRLNDDDLQPLRILHTAFSNNGSYYRLKIIASLVEEDDLVEDAFWSVVGLFCLMICSIALINNLILRKVWTPFYEILHRLNTYRLDEDTAPIQVHTDTKEFLALQNASNLLITHAQEAYTSQKQFTENASHEMQTPLAIITNKLELLLESESLSGPDAASIANILETTQRIARLNRSLLLLAKIENKQFVEPTRVSINALAQQFLLNFQDFITFRDLTVSIAQNADLQVAMDLVLADVLISNLIKNAVFHNRKGGVIHLRYSEDIFFISNTGDPTPLDPKRIFDRFQKNRATPQGTGLGLAVCRSICAFYSLPLRYEYRDGAHCFTVNFKKIKI